MGRPFQRQTARNLGVAFCVALKNVRRCCLRGLSPLVAADMWINPGHVAKTDSVDARIVVSTMQLLPGEIEAGEVFAQPIGVVGRCASG